MSEQLFFVVSACAVRVRGTEIEIVHGNGRLIMPSAGEARELARRQALAAYPPAEGWTRHDVVVNELTSDGLRDALYAMGDDEPQNADVMM